MLSYIINTKYQLDVAIFNIPQALMQADTNEELFIYFDSAMIRLLAKMNQHQYSYALEQERGQPIIYMHLNKALYGNLKDILHFWENLNDYLQDWDFKTNPYDWHVANKEVKKNQYTTLWHSNILKAYHKDHKVVSVIIKLPKQTYSKESYLTVHQGKRYTYLNLDVNYKNKGKATITMIACIG